jgi:hypothetical protein
MNFWLNEKYLLSGTIYTGIFASQSNIVEDAFTLAITRRFSGH